MKYILALALSTFVVFSGCHTATIRDKYHADVDFIGHVTSVRIVATCEDGKYLGSGIIINSNTILTAQHVTICDEFGTPATEVVVVDYLGNEFKVVNETAKDGIDVTKLSVKDAPFKYWAQISKQLPRIGATVCWYGGDGFIESRGYKKCGFYEGHRVINEAEYEWMSGKPSPGNSGSGILDEHGQLIGILNVGSWHPAYDQIMGFTRIELAP
jgi:trypsin-like peptidase